MKGGCSPYPNNSIEVYSVELFLLMVIMCRGGGDFRPALMQGSEICIPLFFDPAFSVKMPFSSRFFLLMTEMATSSFGPTVSRVSGVSGENDS